MPISLRFVFRRKIITILLLLLSSTLFAQLTGIKTIPGNYASIAIAVTDLNTAGAGTGGVIFNIAAGYAETITSTISLTATGTLANPVVFQKDPSTTGANPLITAYTGGTSTPSSAIQDGIWRIVGSDYITINGIDVRDNPANTSNPSTMEYGYALYKASTSNGCQYITISNCVVTLNRINDATGTAPMVNGSNGIIVMNALPSTATTAIVPISGGANSNNKFYANTLQNCNGGIALIGYAAASPFTLADTNNDIGGNAYATGNIVINFGGASASVNSAIGIRTGEQYALNVSYNTVNNNNGSGINHPNAIRGLYIGASKSAASTITFNIVTIKGGGTTHILTGIENLSGSTAALNNVNISNNSITNSTYSTATTGGFYGISNTATPSVLTITSNTISNNSSAATTTGFFYGIYNNGIAGTVSIRNNTLTGNSTAALTSGLFAGIFNAASVADLSIINNTIAGNSTSSVTGSYQAIYNSGTVTTTIIIDSNNIGTTTSPAINFTAANSAAIIFIRNTKGASGAALSVSGNKFNTVLYSVTGTGANTLIANSATTRLQAINGNIFTNLNVNSTGSLTFISNSVAVSGTGVQNVNNNSIAGTFSKSPGGTVTLFSSSGTSVLGAIINYINNNFSNITVTGATTIAGWVVTDIGSSTKNIQNNTFSNWTGGTGGLTAMSINVTGANNATTGNIINNISGGGAVTGMSTAAGNDNIYANTIHTLSTSGAFTIIGISVIGGTTKNIYRNKIYNLTANNAGGKVYGISVSGTTTAVITANIYNNLIGDLRTPVANSTDAIRGVSITTTRAPSNINLYYNTVYLNATSSGASFGTIGIYHTSSTTSTTAKLDLRNNIITNTSTPNGTGFTVAYRRATSALANYATTSNNNLLYAGSAGINRLLFYDGATSDQDMTSYKTRVTPADALSVTEDLITSSKFLSTTGSSAFYLHLDPAKESLAESGALNITGFENDYDTQARQGNPGYTGGGSGPDIGADELESRQISALAGTYTIGAGQTFTSLTNAGGLFAAINTLGLSGNVIANITSDLTEDGSNNLFQWAEQGSGNYTLAIQPDGPTSRVISGNVLAGLIRFNGADRVSIDGRNSGSGSYLTFRNTNNSGTTGTAFTFINGASNNIIRNSNIEASANAINGVILFSTSTVSGGNSGNLITNCNINATVGGVTGILCIYSAGTANRENASNIISNNNLFNYNERGLHITSTGSKGWTINANSLYNGGVTGSFNYAASSTLHGIRILGGTGYAILNNYIGGNAPLAAGTNAVYSSTLGIISYQAILLNNSAATPASSITGNTIRNISVSTVPTSTTSANIFTGIETSGFGINIGGSVSGDGNIIGSNTANSSIVVTTSTTSATYVTNIRGITCASNEGIVSGNQVAGIDIRNVGTDPGASSFTGIYINAAIPPSQVINNIIGSTGSGAIQNSIRVLSSSTSTSTSLTGISVGTALTSAIQVDGNIIQNISHQSLTASGSVTGIINSATAPAAVTINNNTIANNLLNATAGNFFGIYNINVSPPALTITNNSIINNSSTSTGSGLLYGIYTLGAPPTITINNNIVSGNSTGALTSGYLIGIFNAATAGILDINGNTLAGNITSSTTGNYYSIFNLGAVSATININSNNIGTGISPAITFTAANSGHQILINNTAGAITTALSVNNNNFYNVLYTAGGTGSNIYISNTATTLSQTISSNTFNNLAVNTTGNITFISNNVSVSATGTQNVNNNTISGTFLKSGNGGTLTLFTSSAASASGSLINNNSNNFSNITVSGSTVIGGWVNTDAGASRKTIEGNIFTNWTGGSGAITALSTNVSGAGSAVTGNMINNISGTGVITGIATGDGNDNIYLNTIHTLSTTGSAVVTGISVTAGATKNIYKNKIYNLLASNATGSVNGILVSGATIVKANIYNNLIGDLRTPVANAANDAIRGISITAMAANSSINVYYNTIYLNAVSTGANFGSSGIYHITNTTATTASLDLRNNSITNTSIANGTGITVAYRRSSATLSNYVSTSNNNLFYAGVPGIGNLVFYDGTNGDQTIVDYKSRVAPADAVSITENITAKFLSITGSSAVFLHMDATIASLVVTGAANISGYTDDVEGQIRAGNPGYSGTFSTPDIGADEIFGIEIIPPVITYTPLGNTTSTANRSLTGVDITDASKVNIAPGTKPRVYYKRFSDANAWLDNTSSTNGWKYTEANNSSNPFNFTIDYSVLFGGANVTAGVLQYFIVAQDDATVANTAINSGSFNVIPASVALTSSAFPITGTINSYHIPFAGTYNVGNSEVFTSFTKADGLFAAINSVGLTGSMVIKVTSNLAEDGANALLQWSESGAGDYTLTIQPDGSTIRNINGNAIAGLIRLDGADRVTIKGNNGGSGNYLNFRNTSTSGSTGTAFSLINGATNNVIKRCDIEAYTNAVNGVILFGTSSASSGNSNNVIDSCTITSTVASNTGEVAIFSGGTVGKENSANIISNNTIINFRSRAIDIASAGSTGWNIKGNNLYNGNVTGSINYAPSSALHGIRISGGSGYSILNNYIGGNAIRASGTNALYSSNSGNVSYTGILLSSSGAVPASDIRGNTIAAITVSSVPLSPNTIIFTGIETTGSGINIGGSAVSDGNIIGSGEINGSVVITTSTTSAANTSVITGISCASSGGVINRNIVGGFNITNSGTVPASSAIRGVFVNNASAPAQVNYNLIGSALTANSIQFLPASASSTPSLTGIGIGTSVNSTVQVTGNRIDNISNLSTTSSGSFTGIQNSSLMSSSFVTISNDTIQRVSTFANASTGSTAYSGIVSNSASTISNNLVNGITLSSSGVNAQLRGIHVSGAYANTISGNIISNLSTSSNKLPANTVETGDPEQSAIIGILNSASVPGQIINNNRFSGFSATSNAGINVVITGIGINANSSGNIFNNRFGTMINLSTGTGPAICHIMAANGAYNAYNNTLRISNLTNTNIIKIYGIVHASGNNWNYFHNTVRVGGNSNGNPLRSAAFLLSGNSSPVLKNNIFYNIRTGPGSHYAVSNLASPPATWLATASDYNNLYSINPNTIGEWGSGINQTLAQWKSTSGGDVHSISNAISFITSTYDMQPDSISNCNINNAGIPITTPVVINADINNDSRSTVNPDMGSYEFNYTGFTITASSSSPVCAGDSLNLMVSSGNAVSPSFSWRNPANAVVAVIQNPVVATSAGQFKVTVTDLNGCFITDSTLVAINQRATATISSITSICDSGLVNLNITVTGTGLINGTLSNGDEFSGTAPLIVVPVFVTSTTSFSITDLSIGNCSSIPADRPDTVTISVAQKGEWLGITTNWSDPVNWCGGLVPNSSTNVTIPEEVTLMPVLSDSAFCNNLIINAGATLTIAGPGVINVAGTISNSGTYTDNGTTNFNGASGIQTFSGISTFNNLKLSNPGSLLLPVAIIVKNSLTITRGILNANNLNISVAGNWVNNASLTAFTSGTATTTFNGTVAQAIGGIYATTFNNLTIANPTSAVTLTINAIIRANLSVSAGIFDLGSFTANRLSAGGTLTVSNNATLKIGGTNTYPANYTTSILVVASTVEYSGINQAVSNQVYGNLRVSGSGGVATKSFPATPLTIVGNLTSILGTGTSVTFTAASAITVNGNVSIGASTTFNGGSYLHNVGANWVNSGTFNGNSGTIVFTGAGATVSGSGVQNFNHLTVANSGIGFSSGSIALTGNLATTGSGSIVQAPGGILAMSGTGTTISGAGISLNDLTVSGTVTTSISIQLAGNLSVSGSLSASSGDITMSGSSKTIAGPGTIALYVLTSSGSVTTNANFSIALGFIVNGSFSASAGAATFTGTSSLSGTANLYNIIINGTSLQLSSGSVLGIANILTITSGTLDVSTSGPNTVNFNGAGAQNINSITYGHLILSNGNTKTAVNAITTLYNIIIGTGTTFNPSSYTHSVYGNWINNGTFIPGTGDIQFVGPATAYITGNTTFNILTSNTTNATTELILQNNISAATVNMINGVILTGLDTLTITGTRTGAGYIYGNIKRLHPYSAGIAYAFEGPDNTITFSAVSSVSSITVSVAKGAISDFPFSGSISRVYKINVLFGTYNATLRLHYEDDELNGNTESSMVLWKYNGTLWGSSGKTAGNITANYIEQSGLSDITNRWTASDNSNLVQWNGSVSTDWNNAANWTVLQGAGSRPPSAADIVDLGTTTFTNQPVISNAVTVKSIIFGSVKAVTLTLGSGGSLTTLGDITGRWAGNATHAINVNNQFLTVKAVSF